MGLPGKRCPVVGDDGEQRSGLDTLEGEKDWLKKKIRPRCPTAQSLQPDTAARFLLTSTQGSVSFS
jgi:hypothetical protein